jgi:hypothetical protein
MRLFRSHFTAEDAESAENFFKTSAFSAVKKAFR